MLQTDNSKWLTGSGTKKCPKLLSPVHKTKISDVPTGCLFFDGREWIQGLDSNVCSAEGKLTSPSSVPEILSLNSVN